MKIVAVTKCPAGLAHTYIAAELLEQTAQDFNHEIKVETQGATGRENILTQEEISNADVVILAIDVEIEDSERFKDKNIYKISIMDFISNPNKLFTQLENSNKEQESVYKKEKLEIKHFFAGITYISPALVVVGFLLFIASFWFTQFIDIQNLLSQSYRVIFIVLCLKIAESSGNQYSAMALILPLLYLLMFTYGCATLIFGILLSYFSSSFFNKIRGYKFPEEVAPILPIYIYPLFGTLVCFTLTYLLKNPIIYLDQHSLNAINFLLNNSILRVVIALIISFCLVFGVGTKWNKMVYALGVLSLLVGEYRLMAMVAVAIGTPGFILWGYSVIHGIKNNNLRKLRSKFFYSGLFGLTEVMYDAAEIGGKQMKKILLEISMLSTVIVAYFSVEVSIPNGGVLTTIFGVLTGHFIYLGAFIISIIIGNILLYFLK